MAGLHLTPDIVIAAYELLRTTPPFRGWRLPHADEVRFRIVADRGAYGTHRVDASGHEISISHRNAHHIDTLLRVMAHEMCHMQEIRLGFKRNDVVHGALFQRLADKVCKYHNFDRGAF